MTRHIHNALLQLCIRQIQRQFIVIIPVIQNSQSDGGYTCDYTRRLSSASDTQTTNNNNTSTNLTTLALENELPEKTERQITTYNHPCTKSPLYYYGYRYYSTELGRWLNRDPMGEGWCEHDAVYLYGFIQNDPVKNADVLGLKLISSDRKEINNKVIWFARIITKSFRCACISNSPPSYDWVFTNKDVKNKDWKVRKVWKITEIHESKTLQCLNFISKVLTAITGPPIMAPGIGTPSGNLYIGISGEKQKEVYRKQQEGEKFSYTKNYTKTEIVTVDLGVTEGSTCGSCSHKNVGDTCTDIKIEYYQAKAD